MAVMEGIKWSYMTMMTGSLNKRGYDIQTTVPMYQFSTVLSGCFLPVSALLLLYDVTNKASFDNIRVSKCDRWQSFDNIRVSKCDMWQIHWQCLQAPLIMHPYMILFIRAYRYHHVSDKSNVKKKNKWNKCKNNDFVPGCWAVCLNTARTGVLVHVIYVRCGWIYNLTSSVYRPRQYLTIISHIAMKKNMHSI